MQSAKECCGCPAHSSRRRAHVAAGDETDVPAFGNPGCGPESNAVAGRVFFADKGKHYADYAKQIDFTKMTHLNLAFGVPPKCDGICTASSDMVFSIQGQSDADIAAIVAAAHAAGVKAVLSIGGGGGDQRIIQFYNAELSAELVKSLDKFVAAHGFDGVDLDIEDPSNMGAPFGAFVNALAATFHPEGKIVTAAVAKYLQSSMPDAALHQFDFINVMIYSSYESAVSALRFYSIDEKVPRDKIVLGAPFFVSTPDDSKEESYQTILAAYPNAWKVDLAGGWSARRWSGVQLYR